VLLNTPLEAEAFVRVRIWGTVNFSDADPDLVPIIGPQDIRIRVMSFGGGAAAPFVLTIQADRDLTAGSETISASNVSWTATPSPPLQNGTLSTVTPTLLGSGNGFKFFFGRLSFYFRNSWDYNPGNYSTTATITLSGP